MLLRSFGSNGFGVDATVGPGAWRRPYHGSTDAAEAPGSARRLVHHINNRDRYGVVVAGSQYKMSVGSSPTSTRVRQLNVKMYRPLLRSEAHQLLGDGTVWDRIAIAQYRDRMAVIEMSSNADFQKDEDHKEAGMDFTIVMAAFPVDGDPVAPQQSAVGDDRLLLLQVVGDADTADVAADIDSVRIGRFVVEDRIIGDDRSFAEARYDVVSREVADELDAKGTNYSDTDYVVIADPALDELARSLTDTSQVLF